MPKSPERLITQEKINSFRDRVQKVPVEQRSLAFVITLGLLGAIFGGIIADIELYSCSKTWSCIALQPNQQRQASIKAGAFAGIGAAAVLSFPAVFRRSR